MNTLQVAVSAILVAVATGAALTEKDVVPILYQSADGPNPDGSYTYNYETGNGIRVQEQGTPQKTALPNAENEYPLYVQGSFGYPANDGSQIALSYVADENGFQPSGEHLPTPPPVPSAILRALEYIAAHPQEEKQKQ